MVKGQMKIQQTAFLLIALTLFFVLVALFVLGMVFGGLSEKKEAAEEETARLLVSRLASSPEFTCGESFSRERGDCVDFDKVMQLRDKAKNYSLFWEVGGIEIRKIFPETDCDSENPYECNCTKENYPDCNYLEVFPTKEKGTGYDTSNFILLCHKGEKDGIIYDKCELAKLIVRYSQDEE